MGYVIWNITNHISTYSATVLRARHYTIERLGSPLWAEIGTLLILEIRNVMNRYSDDGCFENDWTHNDMIKNYD